MRRFTQLFFEMDQTNKTSEKLAAMERYLREVPAEDAAWALYFLSGERLNRVVKTGVMVAAAVEASGLPEWLVGECHEAVGDFSETVALLTPEVEGASEEPPALRVVVEEWIRPLLMTEDEGARRALMRAWEVLDRPQRFVFNKLVRGGFRVGVNKRMVVRALAEVAGIEPAVMAHRVSGKVMPTAEFFSGVMSSVEGPSDRARPYPFCLANQLAEPPGEVLGDVGNWQAEYKWDGTRAQVVKRDGVVTVWSRGEELVTGQFPEIAAAAGKLADGTVIDGEVLVWSNDGGGEGRALGFNALQRRLNRKNVQASLFDVEQLVFVVFDVLEVGGEDVRARPLVERREMLEEVLGTKELRAGGVLRMSRVLAVESWDAAARLRETARKEANAEGLMLKHRASPYGVGRAVMTDDAGNPAGWWKWKVDPYTVDAVLIYAQAGSGKRAGLFTDYTFGVWNKTPGEEGAELVPFAKAYSGLTDEEIREVDAFIRRSIVGRMGPVRVVEPVRVFEIGFEGIQESDRHRSGVAVRFPRILRARPDKRADQADTVGRVRELLGATA